MSNDLRDEKSLSWPRKMVFLILLPSALSAYEEKNNQKTNKSISL